MEQDEGRVFEVLRGVDAHAELFGFRGKYIYWGLGLICGAILLFLVVSGFLTSARVFLVVEAVVLGILLMVLRNRSLSEKNFDSR